MRLPPTVTLLLVCLVTLGGGVAAEETPSAGSPDPALHIVAGKLTADDEKSCRTFFSQLAGEDFDTRQQALNGLMAKGLAVLPLAQEFAASRDPEVSSQAKALHQRILLYYDGYLPADPALKAALAKRVDHEWRDKNVAKALHGIADHAGVAIFIDPSVKLDAIPDRVDFREGMSDPQFPGNAAGNLLQSIARFGGLSGLPRGNVFLITTPERAARLAIQRHTFDWSGLQLNRAEAERVAQALQGFFPRQTELHTGSEVLTLRGDEGSMARAARLIALLQPGAPDAIWPAVTDAAPLASVLDKLAAPATLVLAAEDPLNAIALLKKRKHDVFVVADAAGTATQEPPFPSEISGGAPLRLALHNQPLGMILRWLERRARFPAEQLDWRLAFEVTPAGRLQLHAVPNASRVLEFYAAGVDVRFLYPRGAQVGAESDSAVRAKLLAALNSHLALLPSCDIARDIVVLRGRLLLQGTYVMLARVLDLAREWRAKDAPPEPAAWKTALDAQMDASVEWDGRELTGGSVIPALRKLGGVDILLEDAADGGVAHFELAAKDAQLLPPGKHTLKALLDDLTQKAGAQWRIELGVVVLTPKAEEKPPRRQP